MIRSYYVSASEKIVNVLFDDFQDGLHLPNLDPGAPRTPSISRNTDTTLRQNCLNSSDTDTSSPGNSCILVRSGDTTNKRLEKVEMLNVLINCQ